LLQQNEPAKLQFRALEKLQFFGPPEQRAGAR
jgi:hypothetical protein